MANIEFDKLIAGVRAGDERATDELYKQFESEVKILVRQQLPSRLRRQYETVDLCQDVWKSVIFDCKERPTAFTGPAHLRSFLTGVIRNKVNQVFRQRTKTQKYDIAREEPLYIREGGRDIPREIPSGETTPSEHVQAADCRERIVAGRSPLEVRIIDLRVNGLTIDEIADRVGIHEKAVRRVFDSLRARGEPDRWR